jgi:hypothetical protein
VAIVFPEEERTDGATDTLQLPVANAGRLGCGMRVCSAEFARD